MRKRRLTLSMIARVEILRSPLFECRLSSRNSVIWLRWVWSVLGSNIPPPMMPVMHIDNSL
jgi:hypothetical protein